jgi:hypothetical protein
MADDEVVEKESRSLQIGIYVAIGVVSLILIAGLIWIKRQPSPPAPSSSVDQHLQGAITPGSPEFAKLMEGIRLDTPEGTQDTTALGGLSMNIFTTVRNFTGKNITGLELKGTVVDIKGNPVKTRTVVVIPDRQPVLEPNRALPVRIRLEGFKDTDDRANIKAEITGVKTD